MWTLTGRDGDDGMGDLCTEIGLSGLLHLGKNHGRDFLGGKVTVLILVLDDNSGFAVLLCDHEGPMLHIALEFGIVHLATDETLSVEHCVCGIRVEGVLG